MPNRREVLKLTGAAALGLLATGRGSKNPSIISPAESSRVELFPGHRFFPNMHVVAVRADAAKEMPWLPAEVFRMYSEAR